MISNLSLQLGLALCLVLAISGCGRDEISAPSNAPFPGHLQAAIDSACVQAPNVFTPLAGDGINDRFWIVAKNITDITVTIKSENGTILFRTSELNSGWNGSNASGSGPFTVKVVATTTSGNVLHAQSLLYKLAYAGPCLHFYGTPVAGDQFDPRICGVTYPSNDIFCP